jgi:hypothetical protein
MAVWTKPLAALALALAAGPTVLEGGGVEARLDLAGFRQDLGPGPIRGAYERLGQWSLDPASERGRAVGRALVVSALVDAVPPGVDLAQLRAHVLADRSPPPQVKELASPKGFWFTGTTLIEKGYAQWHLWFHTLAGDRWVELHFSSVGPAKADTAALERVSLQIVRSLEVVRR